MNDRTRVTVNLKQRITGAIVLLALIVIIVPMVLDFRTDYDHVIRESNIPPQPENFKVEVYSFSNRPIEVPVEPVEEIVQPETDHQAEPPVKTGIDSSSVDQAGAQQRIDELVDHKGPQQGGVSQSTVEHWVVQLASLAQEANAIKLRDQVRNKGMSAFVTRGHVNGKAMYRVLVGPKILQSDARKLRQSLLEEIKLDGLVMQYQR